MSANLIKRDELIDCMKGIGILCVLFGHVVPYGSVPCRFIFSFHMPLFFFLSGVLYKESDSPWADIRQTIVKYGVIYLLFNLIAIIKLAILPLECWGYGMSYRRMLWTIFVNGHPFHNGPLWFIVVLGLVSILFRVERRYVSKNVIWLLFLGGGGAILVNYLPLEFRSHIVPFMITSIPLAILFFISGFLGRNVFTTIKSLQMNPVIEVVVACMSAFLLWVALPYIGQLNLAVGQIKSFLAFPMAFVGILMVMLLGRLILRFNRLSRFIAYTGRSSIAFFAMDFITLPLIAYSLSNWFVSLSHYKPTMAIEKEVCLLLFVLNLLVLMLLSPLVNWIIVRLKFKLKDN